MARGIERREIFRSDYDRTDLLKRLGQVALHGALRLGASPEPFAVLSCLAVQHFGLSARAAAHRLGLSDDSILRGLRVADLIFAEHGCTPEDFLP
jgi:hypothetical protein